MKGSNKMNKSLLLASMIVVALAACGKKPDPTPPPAPTPAPAPAPAPAAAPTPAPAPTSTTTSAVPGDSMKSDSMKMDAMKSDTGMMKMDDKKTNPVEDANKAAAGTAVDAANKKAQPAVKP